MSVSQVIADAFKANAAAAASAGYHEQMGWLPPDGNYNCLLINAEWSERKIKDNMLPCMNPVLQILEAQSGPQDYNGKTFSPPFPLTITGEELDLKSLNTFMRAITGDPEAVADATAPEKIEAAVEAGVELEIRVYTYLAKSGKSMGKERRNLQFGDFIGMQNATT